MTYLMRLNQINFGNITPKKASPYLQCNALVSSQASNLFRGGFCFEGREAGCHLSKTAAKKTSQVATKPSNCHMIEAWDVCHIGRLM